MVLRVDIALGRVGLKHRAGAEQQLQLGASDESATMIELLVPCPYKRSDTYTHTPARGGPRQPSLSSTRSTSLPRLRPTARL